MKKMIKKIKIQNQIEDINRIKNLNQKREENDFEE